MSRRVSTYLRQNVLGLVAIFLALSAGAYAVQKAPKNSVVSKSIKDGQVKNGDVGTAAVTADKLAAGAVGSAAIADGAVGAGKLGFDPATQAELNTTQATADATASGLAGLAGPGTINGAGNPVDWTKLKGVPDGFADGIDRLFGLAVTDSSGDSTPSAGGASVLSIGAPGPVIISDLEDGVNGQILVIHDLQGGGTVIVNDGGPFVLAANTNWVSDGAGDTLTLARLFTNTWVEIARSTN